MRSLILIALALTTLVAMATAACPPNYCATVTCPKELTKENCHGTFNPNSSYCNCCPTCTTFIRPGGYCEPQKNAPGNFIQQRCAMHFMCFRNRCRPYM